MTAPKKYNHMFDIGFTVITDNEPEKVTSNEITTALLKRIASLIEDGQGFAEAAGHCDTYVMPEYEEYQKQSLEKKTGNNRTIFILQHQISYWYEGEEGRGREMPDIDAEHVQEMIIKGYIEGELNSLLDDQETEIYGWWRIVKH